MIAAASRIAMLHIRIAAADRLVETAPAREAQRLHAHLAALLRDERRTVLAREARRAGAGGGAGISRP